MTAGPQVSIVMANYNGGRYVAEAIRSLQQQTVSSWELLFVDDASCDDSVAQAQTFARADSRIRVLVQPANNGPAAARNRGLAASQGQWIAVFDSDDLMKPERLERLVGRAACDGAEIVADNLLLFSSTSKPTPYLRAPFASAPRWIALDEFIDSNRLYSPVPDLGYLKPMIGADLLRRSRAAYDEQLRIGEDYAFLARLLASGARLRFDPSALYLYRRHPASTSYRVSGAQIQALLDADVRFVRDVRPLDIRETAALRRRTRSLRSLLLFDDAIQAIKQGGYIRAASTILTSPRIWPLLARAMGERLRRMLAARKPSNLGPPAEAEPA